MRSRSASKALTASKKEDAKPPSLSTDPIYEVTLPPLCFCVFGVFSFLWNPFFRRPIGDHRFSSRFSGDIDAGAAEQILLNHSRPEDCSRGRFFYLAYHGETPVLQVQSRPSFRGPFSAVLVFVFLFLFLLAQSVWWWWWFRECCINWVTFRSGWLKLFPVKQKVSEELWLRWLTLNSS